MDDHPLKGLWILRYYPEGLDPSSSVMDMGIDEAAAHNERHCHYSVGGESRKYIEARIKVEEWLAAQAATNGIQPENTKPLYFLLSREEQPNPPIRAGKVLSIPAENIPAHLVSFTFDDCFYNYHRTVEGKDIGLDHAAHGRVLNGEQTADTLKTHGWPPEREPNGKTPRYIEAQLWTRRIEDFAEPSREPPTAAKYSKALAL